MNLFGMTPRNFKLSIVPLAFNPISVTATWTHPIAVSQGSDMSSTIDIGYDLTLGDVQLYYYFTDFLPSVSLMDYVKDTSSPLYPSSIKGTDAAALKVELAAYTAPEGWTWSNENPVGTWTADPYTNWNLADWLNENTDTVINTAGSYINTIDLFSAYNEENEEDDEWMLNEDILKE